MQVCENYEDMIVLNDAEGVVEANEGPIQQYRCYNGVLISDAVRC